MSEKIRDLSKPNIVPLIVMTIGTTLMAVPGLIGTLMLIDTNTGAAPRENFANVLLAISLAGFVLYFGYILTLIFRRYNFLFWLFSALYNAGLTAAYLYFIGIAANNASSYPDLTGVVMVLLFMAWMVFMTGSSGYYAFRAIRPKSIKLP